MYSAYGELFSLASIDEAVATLYRAYLDTKLIEFVQSATEQVTKAPESTKSEHYWQAVELFRRESLDPFTLFKPSVTLTDEQLEQAKLRESANALRFKHTKGYLYYFDLRAVYWSDKELTPELQKLFARPEILDQIKTNAAMLQRRLSEPRAIAGIDRYLAAAAARSLDPTQNSVALLSSI